LRADACEYFCAETLGNKFLRGLSRGVTNIHEYSRIFVYDNGNIWESQSVCHDNIIVQTYCIFVIPVTVDLGLVPSSFHLSAITAQLVCFALRIFSVKQSRDIHSRTGDSSTPPRKHM
jgi:hypothetical protein